MEDKDKLNQELFMYSELDFIAMLTNNILYNSLAEKFQRLSKFNKLEKASVMLLSLIKIARDKNLSQEHKEYLLLSSLPQKDKERVLKIVRKYAKLSFDDLKSISEILNNIATTKLFEVYVSNFSEHSSLERLLTDIKSLDLTPIKCLPIQNSTNISVEDLTEMLDSNMVIKSLYNEINESFDLGGYLKGTVTAVAGAPGKGKSNFLMTEAAHFGFNLKLKGLWLALGDLMEIDFIARFGSIYYQISKTEFLSNISKYYNDEFREKMSFLDFVVVDPGKLSIEEFRESFIKESEKLVDSSYDFVVIDYDTNFSDLLSGDMYTAHNIIYNGAMSIAKYEKKAVVFIGSQIKTEYQEADVVPMNALSESNRKQAILDTIIGISRFDRVVENTPQEVTKDPIEKINNMLQQARTPDKIYEDFPSYGIINISKQRRGLTKKIPYVSKSFLYKPITMNEYKIISKEYQYE